MPKICYIYNALGGFVGDRTQGNMLAKKFGAVQLNSSPIPAKNEGCVEVDGGELLHPCKNILGALNKIKPDIVFIHTFTQPLVQELPKIVQRYITVVRLAVNFEELLVVPSVFTMLPYLFPTLAMMDCVIAPSEWVKNNLNAIGFKNIVHVPTAVNLSDFPPTKGNLNNILSVGRIGPIKNQIVPILAFIKVRREIPSARLLVVGNGPLLNEYKEMINGMAMIGMGGLDGIQCVGMKEALPFYRDAKLYVQASMSENGSITILEALASGVPIVASSIGGHFYDSEAILFARHDDVDGFADAMIYLLEDENEWGRLHKVALEDIKKYDVDFIVKNQYEPLFEKLIKLQKFKQKL